LTFGHIASRTATSTADAAPGGRKGTVYETPDDSTDRGEASSRASVPRLKFVA